MRKQTTPATEEQLLDHQARRRVWVWEYNRKEPVEELKEPEAGFLDLPPLWRARLSERETDNHYRLLAYVRRLRRALDSSPVA